MAKSKLKAPKICTSNMCIMVLLLFILFFVLYTQTNIFNNKIIEGNKQPDKSQIKEIQQTNCTKIHDYSFDTFIDKLHKVSETPTTPLKEDQIYNDVLFNTAIPWTKCHFHERLNALLDQFNCPGTTHPRHETCTPITKDNPVTTKKDNSNYKVSTTRKADETGDNKENPSNDKTKTPKPSSLMLAPS